MLMLFASTAAVIRLHCSTGLMWPVAMDRVVWSVCLSVTTVSSAKAAELIVMLTWVGPRNHVLDCGSRFSHVKGHLRGRKGTGPRHAQMPTGVY